MAISITIIGTNHYDTNGRKRLTKLLRHLNPDIVSLELTEKMMKKMEEREARRKLPDYPLEVKLYAKQAGVPVREIKSLLETEGYEYYTARDYCRQREIPVVPADPLLDQYVERQMERIIEQTVTLQKMNQKDKQARVNESYSSAVELPEQDIAAFNQRDAETEKIIRSLDGKVVHITGMLHAYAGNYNNLFKRLSDLSPQRMRLNAADKLR